MPKVTFSNENKVQTDNSYPMLKLDYNERALILAVEKEPEVEFVHTLRAPAVGPDGRVIKEEKLNKNKQAYEATKMEFFGAHLCFGDFDTVNDRGVDPDGCPTCRAAAEGEGIEAPKPRYAMHVIRYALQPNSWTVREPYSVTLEAWAFAPGRFNQLVDLAAAWNLREHDLRLGPCENKDFQKFDIQVSPTAEWTQSKERQELTLETFKRNMTPDLSVVIGRRIDKSKAMEDISRVQERVEQAYGRKTSGSASAAFDTAVATPAVTTPSTSTPPWDDAPKADVSDLPAANTAPAQTMTFEQIMDDL